MKPTFSQLSKLIHFERHPLQLSEGEVTDQLVHKGGGDLFLGHFSLKDMRNTLNRMGVLEDIRSEGFDKISVSLDTADPYHHKLFLTCDHAGSNLLLGELRTSEGIFRPKTHFVPENKLEEMNMIIIEWMCLQNPTKDFTPERPRLPGQKYPGLGVARKVLALLTDMALGLKKDGILNFPEYYHNAALYTRSPSGAPALPTSFPKSGALSQSFLFYNPTMQGMLYAMMRDLHGFPLHEVSQSIFDGKIHEKTTRAKQEWVPEEQILPVSRRTQDYFLSHSYSRICQESFRTHSYTIEWTS